MCAQLFQIQPMGYKAPKSLFFSYGSNMHPEQIKKRCVRPERVSVACLEGYRLGFFGHSTVWDGGFSSAVRAPGSQLWGVVYALSNSDWEALDQWQDARFDGMGAYFHSPATVCDAAGNRYETLLYQFDVKGPATVPSGGFLAHLAAGAQASGLPADYVAALEAQPSRAARYPVPRASDFTPSLGGSCDGCGSE